ncbi:MAG: metallophosphatase family protein [Gemmobacter sp.]|jgi:diadenosine tetraphosphatase ApaH/serine/threonine PP2A family protein phosphatase|nr:metallophosphatase family protein [Gemmobacter sp.]
MRYAILTDIHANRQGFTAVLDDLAQRQVDRIVLLGDIVGYGPDPEWCCDRVMALVEQGALALRGNHDAAITEPDPAMNITARRVIDWTRPRLSEAQRTFLTGLPMSARIGETLFVHASANDPGDWLYVTSAERAMPSFRVCDARVILCGHVHVPLLVSCDRLGAVRQQPIPMGAPMPLIRSRRWLAVVGSTGQPRDGKPLAGYAIHDTDRDELTFRRVPYDTAATVARIGAEGLPPSLAMRIISGA